MTTSLLPPNATQLERAIEAATARVGDVPYETIADLADPDTCPLALLPWLAWGLSVSQWDAGWPEATKRAVVSTAIRDHRHKGTRMSVETVLARYDNLIRIVEWHEASPRAAPHTFDVLIPLVTAPGVAPGGVRASAATAEAIIRDVARTKPLREHFRVVQQLLAQAVVAVFAVVRLATFERHPGTLDSDLSPIWDLCLQTEDGEPLQDDADGFLEDAA